MSGSYDFEEQERIAELKAWWEDNRWYVIGAIIAALAAFAGFRGWQYWSASQEADAAAMFRPVAEAAKNKDAKRLASSSQDLGAKHPRLPTEGFGIETSHAILVLVGHLKVNNRIHFHNCLR